MPNIFDRLLIRNFFSVLLICFLSLMGLFVVIDLFDNYDDFLNRNQDAGAAVLLGKIAAYYGVQAVFLFDMIATILGSIALVVVLLILQRRRELHVILAAGIPTYRVAMPLLLCAGVVAVGQAVSRELVLPALAAQKYEARGASEESSHTVEAIYDYASEILIDGQSVSPRLAKLEQAKFILPAGRVSAEMFVLRSKEAFYLEKTDGHPAGWLLKGCTPAYAEVPLTAEGTRFVRRVRNPADLFVVSDVSPDTLYKRGAGSVYLSTAEMIDRIRNPSFSYSSKKQYRSIIHRRFTEPVLSVLSMFLTIPLIVRRKGRDLVANVGWWVLAGGLLFGVAQLSYALGTYGLFPADLAAWLPVMIAGAAAVWCSYEVQT